MAMLERTADGDERNYAGVSLRDLVEQIAADVEDLKACADRNPPQRVVPLAWCAGSLMTLRQGVEVEVRAMLSPPFAYYEAGPKTAQRLYTLVLLNSTESPLATVRTAGEAKALAARLAASWLHRLDGSLTLGTTQ